MLKSLSNLCRAKSTRRSPRSGFMPGHQAPGIESLESRQLLSASAVYSRKGDLTTFIVHQDGTLTKTDSTGTTTLDPRPGFLARTVHAYLDAQKNVAFDVVYTDGKAYEYDSDGEHFVDNNVLDMAHAIGKKGNFQIDILYSNAMVYSSGPDQRGTLKRTTQNGLQTLGTTVRWISNYVDVNGNIGSVDGTVDMSNNLVVTRADSTGTYTLYKAPNGATQDLTEYSQTSRKKKQVVVTTTSGRFAGTYSLQTSGNGGISLGNGTDILVGG